MDVVVMARMKKQATNHILEMAVNLVILQVLKSHESDKKSFDIYASMTLAKETGDE